MSLRRVMRTRSQPLRTSVDALRGVLAVPGVPAVAIMSLVPRLPKGMAPLAVILLVRQATGSYAAAGFAAAMLAVGDAVSAPVQARLVDRHGRGRVLIPIAMVHVVAVVVMVATTRRGGPALTMMVCAGVIGVGMPPVSGAVKAVWPRLVDPSEVPAAYSVESSLQQFVFLLGPLVLAVLVATAGAGAALLCGAALTALGVVGFVIATRSAAPVRYDNPGSRGALRTRTVRVMMACTVLQSATFGALPVGMTALASGTGHPSLAGVLLAVLTVGGLLGTFWPVASAGRRQYVRLAGALAVALAPVTVVSAGSSATALLVVGAALIVAGVFVTPLAAVSYVLVERAATPAHHTETFAWLSTAQATGGAVGAGLAGVVTGAAGGPAAGLAIPPVAVGITAVVARWGLRGR